MLVQNVADFSPSVDWSPHVNDAAVLVAQAYSNTTQLFNPQTITFTAATTTGFSNSLTVTCKVYQYQSQQELTTPTCTPPTSPVPFVGTSATAPLTITAGAGTATPIGNYTVVVTATDTATQLVHTANFTVLITSTTQSIDVSPNPAGTAIPVSFVGATDTTVTFSCPSVTGPNIPAGGEDPAKIGISCQFNPSPTPVNLGSSTPVQVTVVEKSLTAQLMPPARILATLWLGMPAIVLIGSLRFGRSSRKRLLQLLGLLVVLVALLQGVGCGGGINSRPPAPSNPGSYNLLVIGTDSNGTQTSAIIPINVIQ